MSSIQRVQRAVRLSKKAHEPPRATAAARRQPRVFDLTVHVFTTAAQGRLPVKGAVVTVKGKPRATTGDTGTVTFSDLPSGKRLLTVRHECYPEHRKTLVISDDMTIEAEMVRVSLKQAAETVRPRLDVGAKNLEKIGLGPYQGDLPFHQVEFHSSVFATFWRSRSLAPTDPTLIAAVAAGDPSKIGYQFDNLKQPFIDNAAFPLQGTPLVWPNVGNTPDWPAGYLQMHARTNGAWDKAKLRDQIDRLHEGFINVCMGNNDRVPGNPLAGRFREWIVVNEIFNLKFDGEARKHPFWKHYGIWDRTKKSKNQIRKHVLQAFKAAHRKDPDAILILNDFNVEGVDPAQKRPKQPHPYHPDSAPNKSGARKRKPGTEYYYYWKPRLFRELARWVRDRLPPTARAKFAAGFQMHVPMERKRKKYLAYMLLENLKYYRKHRIPVYVTEIDLREPKAESAPSKWTQAEQYKLYRNLFAALVRGGCRSITAWGITDYHDNAEGEHGVFRHCMFSNDQGCKEMGPPHRKRAYYGAVAGILHARSLGSELKKDKD